MATRRDRDRSRRPAPPNLLPKPLPGFGPIVPDPVPPRRPADPGPLPWSKTTLSLPANHGWRAKPGHKIFVADRGAVRLDYPQSFHVVPMDDKSIAIMDAPTNDAASCRLRISVFHLPTMDWSELPVEKLLREAVLEPSPERDAARKTASDHAVYKPEIHAGRRDALDWAWAEGTWIDDQTGRPITTRTLTARGHVVRTTQVLMTYDVYTDQQADFEPFWSEVLRSLQLGQYIADPTNPQH